MPPGWIPAAFFCPASTLAVLLLAWDMETVDSIGLSLEPANLVPHPQWDRETIDNVRVRKFSTAKIAISQMFFSQMKQRAVLS